MAAIRHLNTFIFKATASSPVTALAARGFSAAALAVANHDDWELPLPMLQDTQGQCSGRGLHWVFLGSPGVGRQTYASKLAKLLDVPHISTGDLLRREAAISTAFSKEMVSLMEQGKLVPDDVIFGILSKRLEQGAERGESGFILDGSPRTMKQAEVLDDVADIDLVVNLKLREDFLMGNGSKRRTPSHSAHDVNISYTEMKHFPNGLCREDENVEFMRKKRLVYSDQSKPVEYYYRKQGKLMDFEVLGGIPQTWPRLLSALHLEDNETICSNILPCRLARPLKDSDGCSLTGNASGFESFGILSA